MIGMISMNWKKKIKKVLGLSGSLFILALSGCGGQGDRCDLPMPGEVTEKTLKDVFAEHGMKVGTCISSQVIANGKMAELVLDQYDSLTMENAMKPDYILNQRKSQSEGSLVVEYGQDARNVLSFAKEHGLSMRGHTLIWYSQTPEWIFHENFDEKSGYVGRDEMLNRMETFIRKNFEELKKMGYLDLFYAYDVINEGGMEDGTVRQNHWTEIIGEDYLWYAFYYADKYAPETIDLYYNDYNEQFKAQTLVEFAKTLVDEKGRSLIDGIGLQAHLFTADDLEKYLEGVDILAQSGLKLQLTEIDVGLGKYQAPQTPTKEHLEEQGRFVYELIEGLFERADAGEIKMDAMTFWGFSDGNSWRKEYSPQLFDDTLCPKYAFYGAMQMKDYAGYEE